MARSCPIAVRAHPLIIMTSIRRHTVIPLSIFFSFCPIHFLFFSFLFFSFLFFSFLFFSFLFFSFLFFSFLFVARLWCLCTNVSVISILFSFLFYAPFFCIPLDFRRLWFIVLLRCFFSNCLTFSSSFFLRLHHSVSRHSTFCKPPSLFISFIFFILMSYLPLLLHHTLLFSTHSLTHSLTHSFSHSLSIHILSFHQFLRPE